MLAAPVQDFPDPALEQGLGQLWVQLVDFVAIPGKVS
jgi:hypothetical protein